MNQSIFPKTVSNHEIGESITIIDSLYDNILVIQIVTIESFKLWIVKRQEYTVFILQLFRGLVRGSVNNIGRPNGHNYLEAAHGNNWS